MRRKVVAGNWKMHTTVAEGEVLAKALLDADTSKVDVIIAPPFTHLDRIGDVIRQSEMALAAQNISSERFGAHTGEIAADMLKDLGCFYVIVGHSECRSRGEDDRLIQEKIKRAIEANLVPIICFGEDEAVYESDGRLAFLEKQVASALEALGESENFLLAYEPIWAIGTGKTASAEDAEGIIATIRKILPEAVREKIRILYGGSVKAENVEGFLSKETIDGVLVGGASLKAESFKAIIEGASHV